MTSEQQPLFDSPAPARRPAPQKRPGPERPGPVRTSAAPVWLQRTSLIILVVFCVYIGVILAALPWTPRFWDHNGWLMAHPGVLRVLRTGWARGLVSGCGILDVWIGVSEAVHYKDQRR